MLRTVLSVRKHLVVALCIAVSSLPLAGLGASAESDAPALIDAKKDSWNQKPKPVKDTSQELVSQIAIKYELGFSRTEKTGVARGSSLVGLALKPVSNSANGYQIVDLPSPVTRSAAEALTSKLTGSHQIKAASPLGKLHRMTTPTEPTDPLYGQQPNMGGPYNTNLNDPIGDFGVHANYTWGMTLATPAVVAVIDTGYTSHADLPAPVGEYDFITDIANAGDTDARDADAHDPGDDCGSGVGSSWHGTHVAGIIGASHNSTGIAGVVKNAQLLHVRVLGCSGGDEQDVADAIVWSSGGSVPGVPANATPAKVLNLSLGAFGSCPVMMQDAIDTAVANGSVVVVAAGNENVNASAAYPANCDSVITVASVAPDGTRSSFSNFGANVDIAAPGGDDGLVEETILSTVDSGVGTPTGDTYVGYMGTSMATPHVAAAAAQYMAENPSATPAQVETALKATAYPFPEFQLPDWEDDYSCIISSCGAGIVDVSALLGLQHGVDTPDYRLGAVASYTLTAGSLSIAAIWAEPTYKPEAVTSYEIATYSVDQATFAETFVSSQSSVSPSATVTGLTNGTVYVVKIRAKGASGQGSVARSYVVVGMAPTGMISSVTPSGGTNATVTWDAPSGPNAGVVTSVDVYYEQACCAPEFISVPPAQTSVVLTGLTPLTNYDTWVVFNTGSAVTTTLSPVAKFYTGATTTSAPTTTIAPTTTVTLTTTIAPATTTPAAPTTTQPLTIETRPPGGYPEASTPYVYRLDDQPTPKKPTAQLGKSVTMRARGASGSVMVWKSRSSKVCVVAAVKSAGKVTGYRITVKTRGTCALTVSDAGSMFYKPLSVKQSFKIT
jgi:serine protease